jgi:hypothetical protein
MVPANPTSHKMANHIIRLPTVNSESEDDFGMVEYSLNCSDHLWSPFREKSSNPQSCKP